MNLNMAPPFDGIKDDHLDHQQQQQQQFHYGPGYQFAAGLSSSSPASARIVLNVASQDSTGCYRPQLYQPSHHEDDQNCAYDQGEMEGKVKGGIEFSLLKKEEDQDRLVGEKDKDNNHVINWMCPKMKKPKQMMRPSSYSDTDFSSNSSSPTRYTNSPIRVCADCNTTKTPLWRSGPNGPKSLCNACGIRQRKARRAMAAAAAAANGGTVGAVYEKPPAVAFKIKEKKKVGKNNGEMKKRCKGGVAAVGSGSNSGEKKASFEEFLIKLSNNLAFQRVFPQDEKDAAILLMALSSGLVHG